MYNLKTYDYVRFAHSFWKKELAGKPAMFLEYKQEPGDITRAKVLYVYPNGESEEWHVAPSLLIPF